MITFIIPTVAKTTLPDTVATVQNQSVGDWKIIIGGDGFMPDFTSEDDRISVVQVPRKGEAGLMRNYLASLVETEWIGMLDDDDEIHPDYVRVFLQNKEECDVMVFQMDNYGTLLPPIGHHVIQHGMVGISFAMKTQVLLDNPFDGQGSGEDYRMLYTLQNLGYRIKFLDFLGYYVRPYLRR